MANICITNYSIKGERELLQKIADAINCDKAVVENTIPCWSGNTLAALNISEDGAGRCWWYDAQIDDNGILSFYEEGAWSRGEAISILAKELSEIDVYFFSEELGSGIFETNDEFGEFYEDKFLLDDAEECIYAPSFDTLTQIVSELYPGAKGYKDVEELNQYFYENDINSTAYEAEYVEL